MQLPPRPAEARKTVAALPVLASEKRAEALRVGLPAGKGAAPVTTPYCSGPRDFANLVLESSEARECGRPDGSGSPCE